MQHVIWFTGLSGSGKSTLAIELANCIKTIHNKVITLDGDELRLGINNNLSFSMQDRFENIRRAAEVAKLFYNEGYIVIACLITPTNEMRDLAKRIIGPNFSLIYLNCSYEKCKARDVKGLYKKYEKGELTNFTGKDSVFEQPLPEVFSVNTESDEISSTIEKILIYLKPLFSNDKEIRTKTIVKCKA